MEVEEGSVDGEPAAPSCCEPDKDLETAELRREMHRAIRELSRKLRTVAVYELQGLNYRRFRER